MFLDVVYLLFTEKLYFNRNPVCSVVLSLPKSINIVLPEDESGKGSVEPQYKPILNKETILLTRIAKPACRYSLKPESNAQGYSGKLKSTKLKRSYESTNVFFMFLRYLAEPIKDPLRHLRWSFFQK